VSTIGVITNPHARAVSADPLLPSRLAQIGGERTLVVQTRDQDEVGEAVQAFAERGVDVIAACGGDGTNLALLTEMVRVYGSTPPPLAILRGGTVNTVAENLGIRGSPEEILTRLLACRGRGMEEPTEARSVLCVNDRFGFFFGAGFAARFYEEYNASELRGVARASLMAARVTLSALAGTPYARRLFEPVAAQITCDGETLPHDRWTLLCASTLMNVGLHIRITYRALEHPDRFHLIASGLPAGQLARQLPRTFMARPLSGPGHFDRVLSEARIEFDEPQAYTLDGDLFRARVLTLRRGPRIQLSIP